MLVRLQCMTLDTSAHLSQASARSILPARVLATRVPEVGTAREERHDTIFLPIFSHFSLRHCSRRTVFVRRNCASFRASSLMRSDEMAG